MHIISILGGVWAVAGCLRHCADPGHAATQHAHQVQGCTALRSAPEPCALLRTHRTNISLPAIALSFSTRLTGITPCQHGSRSEIKDEVSSSVDCQPGQDFITATSFQYTENRGSGVYYYPFWTGLPYNSRTGMWVWADNSALSSSLFVLSDPSPQNYPGGACAYLQGDKVKPGDCGELRFCLCEKKKEAQGKKKVD
ncbi:hypothetical protein Y1Q_0008478 [Alligator mississippiensis]|uniref:Oxidized low-density lipoprotein receptor 1 n=1 Tax=Alligator mississippiensis TaxID=8496 RepID=A0A151M1G5_ALLMI|nr:hypothetical protein Y1Q_0008478 [Alligator mississippiensis]